MRPCCIFTPAGSAVWSSLAPRAEGAWMRFVLMLPRELRTSRSVEEERDYLAAEGYRAREVEIVAVEGEEKCS